VVGGHHGKCGARAYNGDLGAEPPAGSKGSGPGAEPLVRGSGGRSPPEAYQSQNLAKIGLVDFEITGLTGIK